MPMASSGTSLIVSKTRCPWRHSAVSEQWSSQSDCVHVLTRYSIQAHWIDDGEPRLDNLSYCVKGLRVAGRSVKYFLQYLPHCQIVHVKCFAKSRCYQSPLTETVNSSQRCNAINDLPLGTKDRSISLLVWQRQMNNDSNFKILTLFYVLTSAANIAKLQCVEYTCPFGHKHETNWTWRRGERKERKVIYPINIVIRVKHVNLDMLLAVRMHALHLQVFGNVIFQFFSGEGLPSDPVGHEVGVLEWKTEEQEAKAGKVSEWGRKEEREGEEGFVPILCNSS